MKRRGNVIVCKCRKAGVAVYRMWVWFYKWATFALGAIVILIFSFYLIQYIVLCIEEQMLYDFFDWKFIINWYQPTEHDTSGYIPTIVVASASLLLAAITLFQAHYSRVQDRVFDFPGNCLDAVDIGLNAKNNVRIIRKYFDPKSASTLLQFSFKESFSSYYKVYPYRLFVCLDKRTFGQGILWEEIEIYNVGNSNFINQNPSCCEILIEGSRSRLLQEYCNKADGNVEYKLGMIFDIRWTNSLIPFWNRGFADIFIREKIQINSSKEIENKNEKQRALFEYNYKVSYNEHARAPLVAWVLKWKCFQTDLKIARLDRVRDKNYKILKQRK